MELQRCQILFICGKYYRILNWRNRNTSQKCARANILFHLMTILEKNHHSILLYALALDPHLQKLTEPANPGVLHRR